MAKTIITDIQACDLIELELTTRQTYSLSGQSLLKDHPILSIVAYQGGVNQDGQAIADPSNAYLKLREIGSSKELINMPLRSLLYTPGYPILQFLKFPQKPYDWDKSQIVFGQAPTPGTVLQLLVMYDPDTEIKAIGPQARQSVIVQA